MDLSKMRYRVKLHTVQTDETNIVYVRRDSSGGVIHSATYGGPYEKSLIKEHMWDVKTPKYHKLSRNGGIINSPMLKETIVIDRSATAATEKMIYADDSSWAGSGTTVPDMPKAFRLSTPQTSIDVAITTAYAGVTANEENALLWAGEFKEAMTMFYSMGLRLIRLVNSTAKQRKDYAKGLLSIKEAQSMTLALLYGLLPLQDSVEQWQKGLLRHKKEGRNTSRGYNRFSDSLQYRYKHVDGYDADWFVDVDERIETNIRAGVLYDVDLPDYPIVTHLDIKNIVSTAYALSRLSFVWDWFINVGNTLAAWSPVMGTRELSAWVTIEEKFSMTARNSWVSKETPGIRRSHSYNGVATQSLTRKSRVPVDRSDLDLLPNINLNLNLDKIFALILLFAKVKDKP